MDDTQMCCFWGVCCGRVTNRAEALKAEGLGFTDEQALWIVKFLDKSAITLGLDRGRLREIFKERGVRIPEPL